MTKIRIALFVCLCLGNKAFAQDAFKGVLLSASDSTVIPFASIKVKETGQTELTDEKGAFTIPLAGYQQKLTLTISAIGVNEVKSIAYPLGYLEKIYVDVNPTQLADYQFVQLSAKDVVIKAIRAIPDNYLDSSYFAYSSFRQYEEINGAFGNILEVEPVVMFRISKTKNELRSTEGFATQKYWENVPLRRPEGVMFDEDGLSELLQENPVYHLLESSLTIGKLSNYSFWFDTTVHVPCCYVVKYYSRSSHDRHGTSYLLRPEAFLGEGTEIGVLTIDRNSFAIRKFERIAKRNPSFSYHYTPNFVLPLRKYCGEFVNGHLIAEYEQLNKKWFVRHLLYQYSNEYYENPPGNKHYLVTDAYEWKSGAVSRYVDSSLAGKFYYKLSLRCENADSNFFGTRTAQFHFTDVDSVYHTLTNRR